MIVIVANEKKEELSNLGVDVIKEMKGEYSADEVVTMFKNFYFNKMILDVTAIKDYLNISNLQKLSMGLDISKIVFLLPNIPEVSSALYLNKLVSIGIYNFTNNINGVKYLLEHENTYDDVSYVQNMSDNIDHLDHISTDVSTIGNSSGPVIIGFKNVTDHAGATSLIYMMKRELERVYGETIYAVEVSRHDFEYFNVRNTISTNKVGLQTVLNKLSDAIVILVDLNDCNSSEETASFNEIVYLVEPSSIKLNKLMRTNKNIFEDLGEEAKIVLNKSLLSGKEISEFEYESKTHIFYNMPPLNDRRKNEEIVNFISKLGIFGNSNSKKDGKFLGIFKF